MVRESVTRERRTVKSVVYGNLVTITNRLSKRLRDTEIGGLRVEKRIGQVTEIVGTTNGRFTRHRAVRVFQKNPFL